jgi:3D (Asp-Asp-Asp) domain-containing protein
VYTRKNAQVDAILMKTGMNNVLLPTLFTVVNNIEQYCVTPDSGSTILFNIVDILLDNYEQCGQQNIVQSC